MWLRCILVLSVPSSGYFRSTPLKRIQIQKKLPYLIRV